ncbi:MAG: hypothetical protein WC804_02115 [Sphingomonas sp.]|uniref:hypothetical protein n=1 Tax=Sphingomonas sp. TaxID=28214 RepID=UPI0035629CB0
MRLALVLPILSLLSATGCSSPVDTGASHATDINAAAEAGRNDVAHYASIENDTRLPTATASPTPVAPPEPGTPGGLPKGGIVSEGAFTPDSAQGAANIVQTYYALLGERRYRDARALWDDGSRASGMDDAAFAASFARFSEYHAQVGAPGAIDAGAGQRYVAVPVVIYGRLKDGGEPYHASGTVTLHRVGDIDGASDAQKSWHLRGIELKP